MKERIKFYPMEWGDLRIFDYPDLIVPATKSTLTKEENDEINELISDLKGKSR